MAVISISCCEFLSLGDQTIYQGSIVPGGLSRSMIDAANDRAYMLFVEAFAAAWAPERMDDLLQLESVETPAVFDSVSNEAGLIQRMEWFW